MKDDLQFQFFLARLFGEKIIASEGVCTITGFAWRGVLYVVDETSTSVPTPRSF